MLRIGVLLGGLAVLTASHPALAQTMSASEARTFVVGKLFTFNCFEGTKGSGRIYSDRCAGPSSPPARSTSRAKRSARP